MIRTRFENVKPLAHGVSPQPSPPNRSRQTWLLEEPQAREQFGGEGARVGNADLCRTTSSAQEGEGSGKRGVVSDPCFQRSTKRRNASTAGFSLIEMVVVFALATGLAFASLRLLDAVATLREGTRAEMQTFRDLHRLADQLRTDTHQADNGRSESDASVLVLTPTDGEELIRYEISGSMIRRTVESGSSSEVVAREGFQLPRQASAQWIVEDEAAFVRLEVASQRPSVPDFSIDAVLNVERQQ